MFGYLRNTRLFHSVALSMGLSMISLMNGDSICSKIFGSFTSKTTSFGIIAFLNNIDAPLWCIPCFENKKLLYEMRVGWICSLRFIYIYMFIIKKYLLLFTLFVRNTDLNQCFSAFVSTFCCAQKIFSNLHILHLI